MHQVFMEHALKLAQKGRFHVTPNPMVGAVLVHDGRILSEGFHERFGGAHAEINAINQVKPASRHLIPEATLYVTLEPCSHFGKTPPCAHRIVDEGIRQVMVAVQDPNPVVGGKGIAWLRNHQVDVQVGLMEAEATLLNNRFFYYHQTGKPWITLKWAESADGFISALQRQPVHLTGAESDELVHAWRASHHAICIGAATAISDDPLLTVRHISGRDPLRLVWGDLRPLPPDLRMLQDGGETLFWQQSVRSISDFMDKLKETHIQSVLIEGGRHTLEAFIKAGIWNEIYRFKTSALLHGGTPSPRLSLIPDEIIQIGADTLYIYQQN